MTRFRFIRQLIGGHWSLVSFGPFSLDNLVWVRGDHYDAVQHEYHGASLDEVFEIDWGMLA